MYGSVENGDDVESHFKTISRTHEFCSHNVVNTCPFFNESLSGECTKCDENNSTRCICFLNVTLVIVNGMKEIKHYS